jgi:hypothetical protein
MLHPNNPDRHWQQRASEKQQFEGCNAWSEEVRRRRGGLTSEDGLEEAARRGRNRLENRARINQDNRGQGEEDLPTSVRAVA